MVDLRSELEDKCAHLDIPLVGVAPADRWDDVPFEPWVPKEFYPRSIFPEVRSVIVIGLPVDLPIVETAPSIWYHELYKTVNLLLDENAYRLALFLRSKGYASIPLPRDGYGNVRVLKENPTAFFSHRHAAYLAGLGSFGVNNMLLTKEYGPRVRFNSIFTSAELRADDIMDEQLCIRCMRCSEMCPVQALGEGDYPSNLTNKERCTDRSIELSERFASPCGICIKVCPVGKDRKMFSRTSASLYIDEKEHAQLHDAWEHVRKYGTKR